MREFYVWSDGHLCSTKYSCASLIVAGAVSVTAKAGVATMSFTADMYRVDAAGNTLASGDGTYAVFDVYAQFNQSGIRLLNLFDMSISTSAGGFVHNDADSSGSGSGRWSAQYDVFGAIVGADSFATIGSGSTPNAASLDPNFSDTGAAMTAAQVASQAGWYASDPTLGWGDVDSDFKVLIGRFVIADEGLAADQTLQVEGSVAYNFQSPGMPLFVTDSQIFTMPNAMNSNAVPNAGVFAAITFLGMARRRRHR